MASSNPETVVLLLTVTSLHSCWRFLRRKGTRTWLGWFLSKRDIRQRIDSHGDQSGRLPRRTVVRLTFLC